MDPSTQFDIWLKKNPEFPEIMFQQLNASEP